MSSRNYSTDPSTRRLRRGIATVTALTALVAAGVVGDAWYTAHEKTAARKAAAAKVIEAGGQMLNGVVTVGDGVNIRSEMKIDNGESQGNTIHAGDLVATTGEGSYANKTLVITRPLLKTDKSGDQWIVYEAPDSKNNSLSQRSSHLDYINVGETVLQPDPGAISIDPYPGLPKASVINVDYIPVASGGFENSASDQQMQGAMTSTLRPDSSK